MERTFNVLDQIGDIVQAEPGPNAAQISRFYRERLASGLATARDQPLPQRLVDDLAKGTSYATNFGLELRCHIVIESEGCSHGVIPLTRHHDANVTAS